MLKWTLNHRKHIKQQQTSLYIRQHDVYATKTYENHEFKRNLAFVPLPFSTDKTKIRETCILRLLTMSFDE